MHSALMTSMLSLSAGNISKTSTERYLLGISNCQSHSMSLVSSRTIKRSFHVSSAILLTIATIHLSSITFLCLLVSTCFVLLTNDKVSSPLHAIISYFISNNHEVLSKRCSLSNSACLSVEAVDPLFFQFLLNRTYDAAFHCHRHNSSSSCIYTGKDTELIQSHQGSFRFTC
ncbi:Defective in cullin neddylation protein 1 [Fusarium oxysporum f. sp. albedinis]|nr:Defective in cullin neddylation protein 1 [Fusarium oxysporum f. sp. albedinis]